MSGVLGAELRHCDFLGVLREKSRVTSGLDFGELEAVGGAVLKKGGQALVLEKNHLHIEVFGGHSEHLGQAPALAD